MHFVQTGSKVLKHKKVGLVGMCWGKFEETWSLSVLLMDTFLTYDLNVNDNVI